MSDLGVMVDSQLNMSALVTAVSRCCMFQLHQLRAVRHSLSTDIGSRLDYCNSLFAGVTSCLKTTLQSVQNAAARFISKSRKFDPVTPILQDLHWLPIRWRVDFKIATLVYKFLHCLAPPYLIDDCIPVSSLPGRQHLWSAESRAYCSSRRRLQTTNRDPSLFLDQTCGTVSQPNNERSRVFLFFAGNWKHTYLVCNCCHAHLWFRTNGLLIIIIV
jgi:hypothetical protein